MISLDLREVLFQFVRLLRHLFVILLQVELLIDCFGDEFIFSHSFDVLQRHVQHVLSHQVSVLRCVGLIDLIDQHELFIVLINLWYGWSENGLNRLGSRCHRELCLIIHLLLWSDIVVFDRVPHALVGQPDRAGPAV